MSSWPWMKDVKKTTTTTLPSEQRHGRPVVAKLIADHTDKISQLRSAIQDDPLLQPNDKHDDLWLLRFLLSHRGNLKKAAKACQHTLLFRKLHDLDAKDIRLQPPSKSHPKTKRFLEYCPEFCIHLPDPTRGIITYISLATMDQHGLLANVADEDVQSFFIYVTEWSHQWLDYITRTTGLLTKAIRILDLQGMTLAKVNRDTLKRNARYVNEMEDCYPQLLQSAYMCHAPALAQVVWVAFRPLLPKRLVDKLDFINPAVTIITEQHDHRRVVVPNKDLDKLLQHIDEQHLAERFGGQSKTWPVMTALPPNYNG